MTLSQPGLAPDDDADAAVAGFPRVSQNLLEFLLMNCRHIHVHGRRTIDPIVDKRVRAAQVGVEFVQASSHREFFETYNNKAPSWRKPASRSSWLMPNRPSAARRL